jgi:integrase
MPRKTMRLTYALKYASKELRKGIGLSKRLMYKENNGRTPYIHSWSTFNRYMGIAKEFVGWAKERGINRVDKVSYQHIREFLEEKIQKGVSQKTLKINQSALEKFFSAVGREDLTKEIKRHYQEVYGKGRIPGSVSGFANPEKVIEGIKNPVHKAMARLQYYTGARVGDIKKMKIESNRVVIEKSKGGKTRYIDYTDRPHKLEQIKKDLEVVREGIKNTGWREIRATYSESVREASRRIGDISGGPHNFRANYVQERVAELKPKVGYEKALQIVEKEIGHNRVEMTKHYGG